MQNKIKFWTVVMVEHEAQCPVLQMLALGTCRHKELMLYFCLMVQSCGGKPSAPACDEFTVSRVGHK